MFRENNDHLQPSLFSDLDHLTKKSRAILEQSWAGVFRREFFNRLDETPFAVLYSDEPSRPNTPINVLVGLESLKSSFGWSDAEMRDAFLFDIQVRYALGYNNLGEGEFDIRTIYYFRQRLSIYMHQAGKNLIEQAFEQITDEQITAFQLKTGRLRMDSSQIASNIRRMSRIQLLVEVVQRVHRMLSEAEQTHYAEDFAPYLKGSSGQYVYHLKGEETEPHLQQIGELMHRLLVELVSQYAADQSYQLLKRVFQEQFTLNEETIQAKADEGTGGLPPEDPENADSSGLLAEVGLTLLGSDQTEANETVNVIVQAKEGREISPSSLQAPDDPQATYRTKGGKGYTGYAVNLSDTCEPENPFQLIVKVQTAPNTTEDTAFLLEAIPTLRERTDLHTIYNDATFCSSEVDEVLRTAKVEQVPTALKGKSPDPNRFNLADCQFHFDADGRLTNLTCPHGHNMTVEPGRKEGRYIVRLANGSWPEKYSGEYCGSTSLQQTQQNNSSEKPILRFSQADLDLALRRQRSQAYHLDKGNLRSAIEAVVGAVKRPFKDDQLPVRGTFRMSMMMVGAAALVNIRRIQRYLGSKNKLKEVGKREKLSDGCGEDGYNQTGVSFLSALWISLRRQIWFIARLEPASALRF